MNIKILFVHRRVNKQMKHTYILCITGSVWTCDRMLSSALSSRWWWANRQRIRYERVRHSATLLAPLREYIKSKTVSFWPRRVCMLILLCWFWLQLEQSFLGCPLAFLAFQGERRSTPYTERMPACQGNGYVGTYLTQCVSIYILFWNLGFVQ
jgi:hypothetical protein